MGAFNPSPAKTGAERGHVEEVLLEGLLEQDGDAIATEVDSYAYAERLAESRCLAYLWHLNTRFANEADPLKTTDFLPRWERIYGLRPLSTDTPNARRAKLAAKIAAFGAPPSQQVVNDLLTVVLGDLYGGIVNTTSSTAAASVPGGAIIPGGPTLPDGTWYSTIAHLAIRTVQPANVDDAAFYEGVGQLSLYLDDLLPAWVTWDWFRDGPSGAGFFLDDDHNLDNERFD